VSLRIKLRLPQTRVRAFNCLQIVNAEIFRYNICKLRVFSLQERPVNWTNLCAILCRMTLISQKR